MTEQSEGCFLINSSRRWVMQQLAIDQSNGGIILKVLLFCCKGFEMMEFALFYDVCGWAHSEYGLDSEVQSTRKNDCKCLCRSIANRQKRCIEK